MVKFAKVINPQIKILYWHYVLFERCILDYMFMAELIELPTFNDFDITPNLNRISIGFEPVIPNAIVVLDEGIGRNFDTPIKIKKEEKMQKADLSNLGTVLLVDKRTGETIPWEGVKEISSDDLEETTINEMFSGDTMYTVPVKSKYRELNSETYDKTPNPIYIPKHVQHRKKGRR